MQKMLSRLVVSAFILSGLAACGGGGGGGPSGTSSKAFVVDSGNCAIGSMINPNPSPGTLAIDRIISGPSTGLGTCGGTPSVSTLPSLALDPAGDRIYVATQLSVLQWENAGLVTGNVPRTRTFTSTVTEGMTTRGVNFHSLFLDTTNNRLYAAEANNGHVQVYNGARTLSGAVTPSRSIATDLGTACCVFTFGVAVDLARDMLYVGVVPSDSRIAVFHNQASINVPAGTAVTPDRVLNIVGGASSFYLDTVNDRLYVAITNGPIRVYDNASTLTSGTPSFNRTFTLGNTQKYIFVDVANNRLYGVSENLVFIIPNASTADGLGVTGTVLQVQSAGSLFSAVAVKP
jgi:hypothetical protein